MGECCRAICSTADTYDMTLTEKGTTMNPLHKAMLVGEMVHMDYMFFEHDENYCTVRREGDGTAIYILLCLCYCYGCLCPCKVSSTFQTRSKGAAMHLDSKESVGCHQGG